MKIITGYTGEKHITPADDASLIKGIFGGGDYVLPTGNQFKVTMQSNTEIKIADGDLVMQGRHARIDAGEESLTIENGSQGMNRNDLIVARYTKEVSTSVEAINLVVIKGTAASGTASDPAYNNGDINDGETRDFPLYRVRLNGISIEAVEPLFETKGLFIPEENKSAQIVKLWTNASPKSTFAAQTISLNLSDYDGVIVKFSKQPSSVTWIESRICFKGDRTDCGLTYYAGIMRRYVDVGNETITFSACSRYITFNSADSGVTENDRMIPVEIYGFKGVQ